jgi:hypothetical protein
LVIFLNYSSIQKTANIRLNLIILNEIFGPKPNYQLGPVLKQGRSTIHERTLNCNEYSPMESGLKIKKWRFSPLSTLQHHAQNLGCHSSRPPGLENGPKPWRCAIHLHWTVARTPRLNKTGCGLSLRTLAFNSSFFTRASNGARGSQSKARFGGVVDEAARQRTHSSKHAAIEPSLNGALRAAPRHSTHQPR